MKLNELGPFFVFEGGPTGKVYLPKTGCAIMPIPGVIGECMVQCGAVQVRINARSDEVAGLWTGGDITAPPPPTLRLVTE